MNAHTLQWVLSSFQGQRSESGKPGTDSRDQEVGH